jgi:hypothetical protein
MSHFAWGKNRNAGELLKPAVLLFCTLCAPAARAQDAWGLPDFSATQITQVPPASPQVPPWKLYKSGADFRVDKEAGQSTLYIAGTKKIYDTFAHPAFCIQLDMDKAKTLGSPLQQDASVKIKKTPITSEEFEGHKCRVEDVVLTSPEGAELHAKVWEAEDLKGFPVKIEAPGAPTFVFRDIVLEAPDPALFQPPAKCPPLEKIKPKVLASPPVKK